MGDLDSLRNTLADILLDPCLEAKELPLSLFKAITDDFSDVHRIAGGTFGEVYKGLLPNNKVVAVKRLKTRGMVVDDKGFDVEVASMMKLRNKNIVRLLGYCSHTEEKLEQYRGNWYPKPHTERLLCMEFVPHGPIPTAGPYNGAEWQDRYQIIKGICNGLDSIHNKGCIHLDLKPANILLDSGMVPRITDFGISRFFHDKKTHNTNSAAKGSDGYTAPEYINDGCLSSKADIFSLGVIICEIVTGKRGPMVHEETPKQTASFLEKELFGWNNKLYSTHGRYPFIRADQQVKSCLMIAMNCKDHDRHRRRTAKQISHIIELALDPNILDPAGTILMKHFNSQQDMDCSLEDMDLHPNKSWVLLSLSSGDIEILNHETEVLLGQFESLGRFKLSDNPVHSAKFVDRNDWNIVAADDDGILHVCKFIVSENAEKLVKVKTFEGTSSDRIKYLAVQPSKSYLLVSNGTSIMIWNTDDWTIIMMHHGPSYFKTVTHASFNTNDNKGFIIGCCDGKLTLWNHSGGDSNTRRPYLVLHGHSEHVCSIDYFTRDSAKFLVTGSMDKTAKVWKYDDKNMADGYGLPTITEPEGTLKHEHGVTATCYIPELEKILTGTTNGDVFVFDAKNYWLKRYLCFGLGRIHSLALLMGRRVFIGHEHGMVLVEIDPKQL